MDSNLYNENLTNIMLLLDQIDKKTNELLGEDYKLFGNVSTPISGTLNEAAFIRLVSIYYVLFHEIGKSSIDFLISEFNSHIFTGNYETDIRRIIHSLRTYFHHNLSAEKAEDQRKIDDCEQWFSNIISKNYPEQDRDWKYPLINLLTEGQKLLTKILSVLEHISSSETSEIITKLWTRRVFNNYKLYDFERLCNELTENFDINNLNSQDFCNKRLQKWRAELNQFSEGYNFEVEASKLIERDIMLHLKDSNKLPITGKDILNALEEGVKPGERIGITLQKCKDYYNSTQCSKAELLEFAVEYYNSL
jgi:hypothetical protein